jgi:acyl-CoA thioesterase-1
MDNPLHKIKSDYYRSGLKNGFIGLALYLMVIVLGLSGCDRKPESVDLPLSKHDSGGGFSKTIVALGDSLTAGLGVDENQAYPAQLERKLLAHGYNIKVINAGISGETSSGTLSRIDWIISALKPDIVILVIGANDGLRGIDTTVLSRNLDGIISTLKEHGIRILLGGMQMLPNLGPEYAKAFAQVYPKMANKYNVPLIPFFLEGVGGEKQLNQSDGIHPTAKGYAIIVKHLYPYVLKLIKD